jgi:CRP-like cAMP-binding protein
MNNKSIDAFGALKRCPVFATLTDNQLRELAGKARVEHFTKRTLLTLRGETPDHIRFIASGSIDLVLSTSEGGYSSLPMFEGRWATWLGCFGAAPLVHDLWSSNNATCIAFPCRDVKKAVGNNADALREVIEQVGDWTRFLTGWMLSFAAYGPEKRLVYLLLLASSDACAITREGQPTALTHTHISQFGFGSRQKVSRLLRGLAEKGLVELRYGVVTIPSRARLQAYLADDNLPATRVTGKTENQA